MVKQWQRFVFVHASHEHAIDFYRKQARSLCRIYASNYVIKSIPVGKFFKPLAIQGVKADIDSFETGIG